MHNNAHPANPVVRASEPSLTSKLLVFKTKVPYYFAQNKQLGLTL